MCGIIGFKGNHSEQNIVQALPKLFKRGPDSQGVLNVARDLTFGASRLAMTDPHPRSDQPMRNLENGDVIVFNGEIYNFLELRERLSGIGVQFNTNSDTEVLLKSLSVFGVKIVPELEGMFSFVYYNNTDNVLILARDYLGKKPLYFYLANDQFYFSSQINIIKDWIGSVSLNNQSLETYLLLGYVIDPQTMFREIHSMQPGTIKVLDLHSLDFISEVKFTPLSIEQPVETPMRKLLEDAVKERTIGHDKFALSLSGGIDSTIVALIASGNQLNFEAFTMRWPDSDKDRYNLDFEAARLIAKKLKIKFHAVDAPHSREIPELLAKFVTKMEEPNSNPTGISMLNLFSEISNTGNRLVLTGDGSDELFGGYQRYLFMRKLHRLPKISNKFIENLYINYKSNINLLSKIGVSLTPSTSIGSWLFWQQISSRNIVKKYSTSSAVTKLKIDVDDLVSIFQVGDDLVALNMFRDLKTWLVMESNRKLDRISMAFSIEARSPFQSEKVIGSAYNLMAKSEFKTLQKLKLTECFPELNSLPLNSKKMGFISPLGHWLRNNPDMIKDSIHYINQNFDFDEKVIQELAISPQKKKYSSFSVLWNLIVLANWHSVHFKR